MTWPNEPSGSTLLIEHALSVLPGDGWDMWAGGTVVEDATAPESPPNVLRSPFPIGMEGGVSGSQMWTILNGGDGYDELYYGFWWKGSPGFEQHPAGLTKLTFLFQQSGPTGGQQITEMLGVPGGPYYIGVCLQYVTSNGHLPNSYGDDPGTRVLDGTGSAITLGTWYQIEVYTKKSTSPTSQDGIMRWWVNGTLAGNYTTVNYPTEPLAVEWQITPVWGGMGQTKMQSDDFWFDHVRISHPTGGVPPIGTTTLSVG